MMRQIGGKGLSRAQLNDLMHGDAALMEVACLGPGDGIGPLGFCLTVGGINVSFFCFV